jgi:hypothetical protein
LPVLTRGGARQRGRQRIAAGATGCCGRRLSSAVDTHRCKGQLTVASGGPVAGSGWRSQAATRKWQITRLLQYVPRIYCGRFTVADNINVPPPLQLPRLLPCPTSTLTCQPPSLPLHIMVKLQRLHPRASQQHDQGLPRLSLRGGVRVEAACQPPDTYTPYH